MIALPVGKITSVNYHILDHLKHSVLVRVQLKSYKNTYLAPNLTYISFSINGWYQISRYFYFPKLLNTALSAQTVKYF